MDFVKSAAGLTRNPLGIIALFISLIYGMSALLLGVSVTSLEKGNQTALVYFIISFPVVVLAVFGWLVSKHHNKLYGPGDYRTDESFITAGKTSTPIAVGQRLRAEVGEELKAETPASEVGDSISAGVNDGSMSEKSSPASAEAELTEPAPLAPDERLRRIIYPKENLDDKLSRAFAAQNLALQDLQADFGLPVARSVVIADNRIVDGLIVTSNGYVIAEVKYVRSISFYHSTLMNGVEQLMAHISALKRENSPVHKAVLLVVLEENLTKESLNRVYDITDKVKNRFSEVDIKIMRFAALADKYGLSGI